MRVEMIKLNRIKYATSEEEKEKLRREGYVPAGPDPDMADQKGQPDGTDPDSDAADQKGQPDGTDPGSDAAKSKPQGRKSGEKNDQ